MPIFICPPNPIGISTMVAQALNQPKKQQIEGLSLLPEEKQLLLELQAMPEEERKTNLEKLEFERDLRLAAVKEMHIYNEYKERVNEEKRMRHEAAPVQLGYPNPWNRGEYPATYSRYKRESNLAPKKNYDAFTKNEDFGSSFVKYGPRSQPKKLICKVVFDFRERSFEFTYATEKNVTPAELKEALLAKWCSIHIYDDTYYALSLMKNAAIRINGQPFDERSPTTLFFIVGEETDAVVTVAVPARYSEVIDPPLMSMKDEATKSTRLPLDNLSSIKLRPDNESSIKIGDFFKRQTRYPTLGKSDLWTKPSIERLQQMNERELIAVDGFAVGNKYGRIEFEEDVDLLDADLSKIVLINRGEVILYPPEYFEDEDKPLVGEKLNKQAKVTLYGIKSEGDNRDTDLILIKRKLQEWGAELLSYDYASGNVTMRLFHF